MNRYLPIAFCAVTILALPARGAMLLGDANAGKQLVKQHCMACHVAQFGGDGSKIYTRKDHKVKSTEGLLAQVERCNQNVGTHFNEKQINDIVKYLNDTYYKFEE
jgi:mono/diheme cytochrome c family protein